MSNYDGPSVKKYFEYWDELVRVSTCSSRDVCSFGLKKLEEIVGNVREIPEEIRPVTFSQKVSKLEKSIDILKRKRD